MISSQVEKLQEAIAVMQEAVKMGDDESNQYIEQLTQLKTENQGEFGSWSCNEWLEM